jgi:hypothetical protein
LVNNIGQQELEFPQFRSVTDISSIVAATFSNEIAKMLLGVFLWFLLENTLIQKPFDECGAPSKGQPSSVIHFRASR